MFAALLVILIAATIIFYSVFVLVNAILLALGASAGVAVVVSCFLAFSVVFWYFSC